MKTILWATLSANGNYATSSPEHLPKPEALLDFAAQVKLSGNFIAGRKTFEGFQASDSAQAFKDTDIVVVSEQNLTLGGVKTVSSPKEALNYLRSKGHMVALLSGGETLHNSFLSENLIDEIIFNYAPVFESRGMNLAMPKGQYKAVKLIEVRNLGGGVIQHRYSLQR